MKLAIVDILRPESLRARDSTKMMALTPSSDIRRRRRRNRRDISRGSRSFVSCAITGATMIQLLILLRIRALGLVPPERLRRLLDSTHRGDAPIQLMPCVYDGLTARLVAQSGFNVTFMTGFGVSSSRGFPDTQLISYHEMLMHADWSRKACRAPPSNFLPTLLLLYPASLTETLGTEMR